MMNRVELNEEMMEQVNGGYEVGDHVEVKTIFYDTFGNTAGGTITKKSIDSETGAPTYFVTFDHWYDLRDSWRSEHEFE